MRIPRVAAVAASMLLAATAYAQGTGRSMDIDPSPRSTAMGLASNAVFWDQPDRWGNPAFLAYRKGVSYEWTRVRLVPELADDVHLTTNVVELGGGGFGVALAGTPGIGGTHLSYGLSEATDPSGNPIGTFESFEQIDAWGFGLSAARLTEAIALLTGHDPTVISRYADVSFGMAAKHVDIELAPLNGGAETNAQDLGFLVRVSPTEFAPGLREVFGIDVAYGWSDLSFHSDPVHFPNEDVPAEVSEHERSGLAGRARLQWPRMAETMGGPAWIWEGIQPLVSVGYAKDHAEIGPHSGSTYETDGRGWEVTILNVFSARGGHYEDLVGDIDGDTDGWGVNLPLGTIAGVRYDRGKVPQASNSGLGDVTHRSVTAWIDALRVWRSFRQRGSI